MTFQPGNRSQRAEDCYPEGIFLKLWELHNRPDGLAHEWWSKGEKLANRLPLTDRDVWVASSLIQWLGTRHGIIFLGGAKSRIKKGKSRATAFIQEWLFCNRTQFHINKGYCCFQLILDRLENRQLRDYYHIPGDPNLIDPLFPRDWDVSVALMQWLASPKGEKFLQDAEQDIATEKRWQLHQFDAIFNHGFGPLPVTA